MNQRVAKVIRREVFGDKSRRARSYTVIPFYKKITQWIRGKKETITLKTGQLVCTGLREKYKKVKKGI